MRISDWSSDVCSSDLFDLGLRLWTIPKHRMKANREHVVPLCNRAVAIVRRCAELRTPSCDLVFSGTKKGLRSEEHTSELQSLMRISYAVFCLKKKNIQRRINTSVHD